jgi:hypothetical protein
MFRGCRFSRSLLVIHTFDRDLKTKAASASVQSGTNMQRATHTSRGEFDYGEAQACSRRLDSGFRIAGPNVPHAHARNCLPVLKSRVVSFSLIL